MAETRKGYWWQCADCEHWTTFPSTTGDGGIAAFLLDKLVRSGWNQALLLRTCPDCGKQTYRIAFHIDGKKKIVLVHHIVGLVWDNRGHPIPPDQLPEAQDINQWIPMMWEWTHENNLSLPYFDFKYLPKRNAHSLKYAAHFNHPELQKLFALYCERTGREQFP